MVKDADGDSCGPICYIFLAYAWRHWGKLQSIPNGIVSALAEIQICTFQIEVRNITT
jgi:hypothetical protein